MRVLSILFALLILGIQYPLWLGKGGWMRVWDLDQQVDAQRLHNQTLASRNGALEAEVRDLKQGTDAVEERARYELGLIKPDELFFHVVGAQVGAPKAARSPGSGAAATAENPADKTAK
jgi:cell division protein FtsB